MKINPPPIKFIIFSGGGGLVTRQQKVMVNPGKNQFEIQDVPASFDPETSTVDISSTEIEKIKLIQISVKQPDKKTVEMVINREKNASDGIIKTATDLRAENREQIISICESAYYRQYEDMFGDLMIELESQVSAEVNIMIKYFISDIRIKWNSSLQIDLDENTKNATIVGYIMVNNSSDFKYENIELEFAEFELMPGIPDTASFNFAQEAQAVLNDEAEFIPNKQQLYRNVRKMKRLIK